MVAAAFTNATRRATSSSEAPPSTRIRSVASGGYSTGNETYGLAWCRRDLHESSDVVH